MPIPGITKPFPEFKWRWASFEPSESLNDPRVLLGVLRVLYKNEGNKTSSTEVFDDLALVEVDLKPVVSSTLKLARPANRNLFRNSQQYWRAPGLLETTTPSIVLTPFGKKVARGELTRDEFAATVIRTLLLPNRNIEQASVVKKWEAVPLRIAPLTLLLSIYVELAKSDTTQAYITPNELVRVIIPLSSVSATPAVQAAHILHFRTSPSFFNTYGDFAPEANDKRIAREFLLFLMYHGFVSIVDSTIMSANQRFAIDGGQLAAITALLAVSIPSGTLAQIAKALSISGEIGIVERDKRLVAVTSRPGQPKFRKDVFKSSGATCLLTGESMPEVLRACHIIPVEHKGEDHPKNGLCLREDIHLLYDSGHLRIDDAGNVHLSDAAKSSSTYAKLPSKISLPAYVSKKHLQHRFKYDG